MRISDNIVRVLIFLFIAAFVYLFFVARSQYLAIENQQPDRPSVSETLHQLDNGKEATLDAEDYEDDNDEGIGSRALSTVQDGVGAVGSIASEGVNTAKDAFSKGTGAIGNRISETATAANNALSSTGEAIKATSKEAIASTPSIDDLVALKEEQAKKFEAQEDGEESYDVYSPTGSSITGNYMVVAGTYRQMINAESELKKLKGLGYQNATIAKFNKSTYASLIVDRFSDSAAAYKYKKKLEGKGMDVYVHKKR